MLLMTDIQDLNKKLIHNRQWIFSKIILLLLITNKNDNCHSTLILEPNVIKKHKYAIYLKITKKSNYLLMIVKHNTDWLYAPSFKR